MPRTERISVACNLLRPWLVQVHLVLSFPQAIATAMTFSPALRPSPPVLRHHPESRRNMRADIAADDLGAPEVGTLLSAFECAVEAASAFNCMRLSPQDIGDAGALVIGAGKAAAAMAVAFNAAARDNVRGLVVTRYGHCLLYTSDAADE